MCGIVGYVGHRPARELLLAGLAKLEYRGYDSAGISLITREGIESVRAVGPLTALHAALAQAQAQTQPVVTRAGAASEPAAIPSDRLGLPAERAPATATLDAPPTTGIAHTRWATHGRVSEANAHPHFDEHDRVHIVLNGIVENYVVLRDRLRAQGCRFTSATDAEVVAHLVARHHHGDLADAVAQAYRELEGHYAFVAMSAEQPGVLVGVRKECPLVVGRGDGEQFVASAIAAFLPETRRVQYLEDDELVVLTPAGVELRTVSGGLVSREPVQVDWDADTAEKGGYETFMLKEIHDQPAALADTIAERAGTDHAIDLGDLGTIDDATLAHARRLVVVACGSSYHAGLAGRYAIEEWARVSVEMDVASEYRYRNPVVGPGDLVVGVSQSGETADTLAAMRLARHRGATVLGITNLRGSQITRDADGVLFTRAGLEIGVAATKTFVSQVAALYLLGLRLAYLRGTLPAQRLSELIAGVRALPRLVEHVLAESDEPVKRVAAELWRSEFFLYLGRHSGLPIALEGALKLKEISYIATDAYAAGEMKHGPIALLDERTPVVCVATDSPVIDKVVSNMQEVRARGAHVVAVATEGNVAIGEHAEHVLRVPGADPMLQSLLAVIPLQLLAYRIARHRGLNVDQPRNLAKTVTVE